MLTDAQIIIRLLVAGVLGGFVGFERELHSKRVAGFRTHILVCIASTLIMLVSIHIYELYKDSSVNVDPSRIASGVVTGIGFLGAGTIIRAGTSVIGLTTAASLWTVAGIGLAVGCGFYTGACVTSVIALATLYILRKVPIEEKKKIV